MSVKISLNCFQESSFSAAWSGFPCWKWRSVRIVLSVRLQQIILDFCLLEGCAIAKKKTTVLCWQHARLFRCSFFLFLFSFQLFSPAIDFLHSLKSDILTCVLRSRYQQQHERIVKSKFNLLAARTHCSCTNLLNLKVQKRKKLVSEHQTKTGNWDGWETFRPLRGFFSLRFSQC